MADDFSKAVEDGLKLAKRVYFGKDQAVVPPKSPLMNKLGSSAKSFLPTAPMVYAMIRDPRIVDNPDMPSYQPHVHGVCDPPALIPLQMKSIELNVDCYFDTAFVEVSGSWRVHCVMGSKSCDCRIAIPMGEQGSILGVEAEVLRKSYCTRLTGLEDPDKDFDNTACLENGGFLKPYIFTLTIPQIDGGSNILIKLRWSQKLSYSNGEFSLNIPFNFPEYVNSVIKKIPKKEKIQLNVDAGTGTEVMCKMTSHPLKQLKREVGKLVFSYEAEVLKWSTNDFSFSYTVSSAHIFGGVLLQSPSVDDVDRREMFCMYLFPGSQRRKAFRKNVIFVVDISGSMKGKSLEDTKKAMFTTLSKLHPEDSFNIIGFNGETYLFSTSMELATEAAVERATEWVGVNFIAGGSTNISVPLTKAVEMLPNTRDSLPIIFLVTDGAVEDERRICDVMKSRLTNGGSICPRIYTFGIGTFCNHYFLRTLAMISKGDYGAAYELDSIQPQMEKLFAKGLSTVLANITIDALSTFVDLEMYPSRAPDLSSDSPLIVSGRYQGDFPDTLRAKGILGDLSNFLIDLKIQHAKEIPIDRVVARQQIDILTSLAWFSEDKQLVEKVAKMSVRTSVLSEYTRMILLETDGGKGVTLSSDAKKASKKGDLKKIVDSNVPRTIQLPSLRVGFGDLTATVENIQPGVEEAKSAEAAEIFVKAASSCCGNMCNKCCCMCFIQCCSRVNNQCAIVLTQMITALSCFACFGCCQLCCPGNDGR